MAETLLLEHTYGHASWQVAHAGAASEFALAAVGQCFARRRLLFNLPMLWRLHRIWRSDLAALDPRALRLAMCVDARVSVRGARLDVSVLAPAERRGTPRPLVQVGLPFVAQRGRDAKLPAPADGLAWRVHALGAEGVRNYRRLAMVLASVARGTRFELRARVRESRTPMALRTAFPLGIELQLDAAEGYVTLVPLREIAVA